MLSVCVLTTHPCRLHVAETFDKVIAVITLETPILANLFILGRFQSFAILADGVKKIS